MRPDDGWSTPRTVPRSAFNTRDAVPSDIRRGQAGFIEDLQRALHVWREQPALPALTTALAALTAFASSGAASPAVNGIATVIGLVFFGYVGAERLWYLRAFSGRRLSLLSALRAALSYWPRFFRLGLLVFLVSVPLTLPALPALYDAGRESAETGSNVGIPLAVTAYLAVTTLLIDFSLTFVTPALVFNTDRATEAIRIGLRLLRRSWPHSLTYVLFPPFAVLLLTRISSGSIGWGGAVLIVVSSLLNLVAKGATAAYYLRVMPIAGKDGDIDQQLD